MEDTLRVNVVPQENYVRVCLNPCFNGRYSQSFKQYFLRLVAAVLILVLMEDTLRVQRLMFLCIRVFGGMFKLLETLSLTQINSFLFGCKFTNNFQDVKDRCVKYSLRNSTFSFAKRVLLVLSLRRIMCYANEL